MPARFEEQPLGEIRDFSDDLAAIYEFFNADGFQADIEYLRSLHPGLQSLRTWATQAGWAPPRT
jgi:hypothetical protein